MAIIAGLRSVDVTEEAEALTQAIMDAGILPPHAFPDAAHVAVSAVHIIDYLLTWNCKHLANAQIARRIAVVCEKKGYKMPVICTPEELGGGWHGGFLFWQAIPRTNGFVPGFGLRR
jgi:hypothetical protein